MNNQNIHKLKTYYVRIDWSEENNGDCENTFNLEVENMDQVWDYIFNTYYIEGQKLKEYGEFLDSNMFSWTEYYSESLDKMVFYYELEESDKKMNEYDELDIYYKTYTISVHNEEETD